MKISYIILILAVIIGFFFIFSSVKAPVKPLPTISPTPTTTPTATPEQLIIIDTPQPNSIVPRTFQVSGKARGPWYFEASFPIRVLDSSRTTIATTQAHAQSDWMTNEFVPFTATITIPSSYTGNATLRLEKDNPSGLPQNDASKEIPIVIQ